MSSRAVARHDKGDIDGTIADYTRAIEMDPRCGKAWAGRGSALVLKGDWKKAIDDMEEALKFQTDKKEAATVSSKLKMARRLMKKYWGK